MRNSRICPWRELSTPEECGIFNVGPTSCKRLTVKSTLFCSSAFRPPHHLPNSSENSTSHATFPVCHRRYMSSKAYNRGELDFEAQTGAWKEPDTNCDYTS